MGKTEPDQGVCSAWSDVEWEGDSIKIRGYEVERVELGEQWIRNCFLKGEGKPTYAFRIRWSRSDM